MRKFLQMVMFSNFQRHPISLSTVVVGGWFKIQLMNVDDISYKLRQAAVVQG